MNAQPDTRGPTTRRLFPAAVRRSFLCLLLPLLHVTSCDMFETRAPEDPRQGGSTYQPPTSPDLVLTNLKNAIAERNTENYIRSLVDTLSSSRRFEFLPTSSASGRYPSIFANWSTASERTYFDNIRSVMQETATSSLILTGQLQVLGPDSAFYNADYQLTFPHELPSIPQSVRGNIQLSLATDRNKIWSIHRWIDTGFDSEPSWSDLKARFSN